MGGPELAELGPKALMRRPEVAVLRPKGVVGGSELAVLRLEVAMSGLERAMLCLEGPVGGLELAVGREEPLVSGLEAPILPGDTFQLALEPIELFAEGIAAVADRGRADRRLDGWGTGRVRDEEGLIASLAADLVSKISPPDAQRGAAIRAGHEDPLDLGGGRGRRLAGPATAPIHPFLGHEDLIALLALDLLADISPPDLQVGRAVGAVGEEMGLSIDHGITLASRRGTAPIGLRPVGLAP